MEEALILLFALAAASVVERAGKWTGLVFFSIATMILAIVVARPIQGAAVTVSDEEWAETVLWYHKHGLDPYEYQMISLGTAQSITPSSRRSGRGRFN